jgi:ubiquinone/menaquinone biosynthesis C-methylase UbiE
MMASSVPGSFRARWQAVFAGAQHKIEMFRLFGRSASLIPPLELMHDGPIGYQEFKANGEEFFGYYTGFCGLRPDDRVLDVGSGIGRKTFLLTRYLSNQGSYEGLDIVKTGVDWCTNRITSKHPQFRFQHADIYNQLYNPEGRLRAVDYKFPFPDNSFDFIVLASVFTHMLPEDSDHYLAEVARVLKEGGRCLISFFLLNDESIRLISLGKSTLNLTIPLGACRVVNANLPEQVIGYDEEVIRSAYRKNELAIATPVYYGSWCGRENFLSYQDLIIAHK